MYFRNPAGRIVAIDDPEQIERYEAVPGFTHITIEEERAHIAERTKLIQQSMIDQSLAERSISKSDANGVYFATVTQNFRADGYGVASACMMEELSRLGIEVKTTYKGQRVGILFHNPYGLLQMETDFRVLYTMFESDRIPDDWHSYLEVADLILVPSEWCKQVFAKAGFEAQVVALGYDDLTFQFRERENKREANKTFTFLHYNAFNIRKGFSEVFRAFVAEFERDEPVQLVLKTTQNPYEIPSPFRNLEAQYPNIQVIAGKVPSPQMQEMLTNSDCFLFPSRGEGFGMTPLEAMATGLPVIVPNAHGISEYFDPGCMYGVEVEGPCPALYTRYKGMDVGNMVVCSTEDLRRKMRWVYEHQAEALEKGKTAAVHAQNWTLRKTAAKLKEIILDLQTKETPERKLKNVLSLERIT